MANVQGGGGPSGGNIPSSGSGQTGQSQGSGSTSGSAQGGRFRRVLGAAGKFFSSARTKKIAGGIGRGAKAVGGAAKATAATTAGVAAGAVGFALGAASKATQKVKHAVKGGNLFIIFAILIIILDNKFYHFPWLFGGSVYHGFKLKGLETVDWLGLITSSIFLGLVLLYYSLRALSGHKDVFIVLFITSVFGFLSKYIREPLYQLFSANSYLIAGGILFVVIIAIVIFLMKSGFDFIEREDITFMALAFIYTFFISFRGWTVNPDGTLNAQAMLHFAFITAFGLFYIQPNESDEPPRWHMLLSAFLFADFFLTGYLEELPYLKFVPFLLFFTAAYVGRKEPEKLLPKAVILIAIISVVIVPTVSQLAGGFTYEQANEPGKVQKSIVQRVGDTIQSWIDARLESATGGLYRGQVEKNRYEQLGVYIDKVRSLQPRFYTTEPAIVWGTLKSKTWSDAVIVNFNCNRWDSENIRHSADIVTPKEGVPVFGLEEQDFQCEFNPNTFEAGTHTITLTADYNFLTDAYHKTYFIDRDRYRELIREDIEPFKQYGITDTKPITTFTNGPVEVGMDVTPLIPVAAVESESPISILSISLKNRGQIIGEEGNVVGQFEGAIKDIKELVILVPNGVTLEKETCKPIVFKDYTQTNCEQSCDNEAINCNKACKNDNSCKNYCKQTSDVCKKDCWQFFKGEGTGDVNFKGYAVDVSQFKNYGDDYKNIDRYKTFSCRIIPIRNILGPTPITTRYFRARARYDYRVEKSVSIQLEQAPGTISSALSEVIEAYISKDDLEEGLTPDLVKAVAYIETRIRHCKDSSTKCSKEDVIKNSCCVGLMQINVFGSGGVSRWATDASEICGKNEDGTPKNVYDMDCNLKLGIYLLKQKYNYRGKDKDKIYTYSCPNLGYVAELKGWDSALRGYNGWGCPKVTSTCNKECWALKNCDYTCSSTLEYVKLIRDVEDRIRTGTLDRYALQRAENIDILIPKEYEGESG